MNIHRTAEVINQDRRRFLSTAFRPLRQPTKS